MSRNRGKKAKIKELSRAPPTDKEHGEVRALFYGQAAHPIVTAILGASLVEHDLDRLLRRRFLRRDDETWKSLTDEKGPLSTFYQKIECGYAFKIYDEGMCKNMHIVRAIRNQFAHTKRLITFQNEAILSQLRLASFPTKRDRERFKADLARGDEHTGRTAYIVLCTHISVTLLNSSSRAFQKSTARYRKKADEILRRTNPYAAPLLAFLQGPRAGIAGLPLLPHQVGQSRGSNALAYPRSVLEQLSSPPKNDEKTDK
jgi:hypothetical protein